MMCSALPQIHDMIGWEILWSREEEHSRAEPWPRLSWWDEQKKRAGVPIIMWPASTLPASPSFALVLRAALHPCFFISKSATIAVLLSSQTKNSCIMNRSPPFIAYSNRMEGRRWLWVRHVSRPSAGLTLRLAGEGVRWCIIVSDTRNHFIISTAPAQHSWPTPPSHPALPCSAVDNRPAHFI